MTKPITLDLDALHAALLLLAPATMHDAIDALIELARVEQDRRNRQSTHGPDCHTWGPRHYDCLLGKFEEATREREGLKKQRDEARQWRDNYQIDALATGERLLNANMALATARAELDHLRQFCNQAAIAAGEHGFVCSDAVPLRAELDTARAHLRQAVEALSAESSVCDGICAIMETYREQEAEGYVDTPGGFEHMGDVWRQLSEWDEQIRKSRTNLTTALGD